MPDYEPAVIDMSPETATERSNPVAGMPIPDDPVSQPGAATGHQSGASCGGCSARWTGSGRAHCSGCHQTFATVGYFDRHRRAFACVDPATIEGMREVDGIWRGPELTDEQRARFGRSA
jgi:hypothetical protein